MSSPAPAADRGTLLFAAGLAAPLCAFVAFLVFADHFFPPCADAKDCLRMDWWWGGLQLWVFPEAYRAILAAAPLLLLLGPESLHAALRSQFARLLQLLAPLATRPVALLAATFLGLWTFRASDLAFGDSYFYVSELVAREAYSERGALVGYDSVGASLLTTVGYRVAHMITGLPVLTWYHLQGLTCLLAFLAWAWCRRGTGRTLGTPEALALVLLGNWSQATLGAPENYGQLLLASLAFAILGVEALAGRAPLWKPVLAYSLGAFFHLGIAWLFPAFVYLVAARWRAEDSAGRQAAAVAVLLPASLTGALAYFYGFDLSFWSQSNAAEGKLIPFLSPLHPYTGANYQYSTLDPRHLAHIAQEATLMGWPGLLLLAGATAAGVLPRLWREAPGRFLGLFLAGTAAFNLLWNPDLRFWQDQDLFSSIGLGLCLVGTWLAMQRDAWPSGVRERVVLTALVAGVLWRLPVAVYHSILAPNYLDPTLVQARWPFGI